MDWYLYDNGLCHERVKEVSISRLENLFEKSRAATANFYCKFKLYFSLVTPDTF